MPAEPENFDVTEDFALGGRLKLRQPRRGHRFGHDAVLLAAATGAKSGEHLVEFGAGVGLAGLAVAARVPGVRVTLVDIDPALVALANENIDLNGMADRVDAIALDVVAPVSAFTTIGLLPGATDRVLMNPPYNPPEHFQPSPHAGRAAAHVAPPDTLMSWCKVAGRVLKPGGILTLIWRADRLNAVLAALEREFGGISLLPVHPQPDKAAIRVLVSAAKGSRAPLDILPGLILNTRDGHPTPEAEAVLRQAATLPLTQ